MYIYIYICVHMYVYVYIYIYIVEIRFTNNVFGIPMGTPIALFRPVSIFITSGDSDLCSKSKVQRKNTKQEQGKHGHL